MNIDDLTLGQLRELANQWKQFESPKQNSPSPMIGRHCVIRTFSAGVHLGTVRSVNGKEVLLENARRLWSWKGAFTLSEVATSGVKSGSRISVEVPELLLTETIEIIPTQEDARKTFEAIHE